MADVTYEKRDNVAYITINRTERRNSITSQVINMLRSSFMRANQDPEMRIIVLTGAGDSVFCAGGDLGRESSKAGAIAQYEANKEIADLFEEMKRLKKPVLARVNGHALGVGFALMLAADIVVATETARMSCPELKVGVFPMLTLALLERHIGPKKALEMVLTSQQITSVYAEQIGLVNHVVSSDELDIKVEEIVSKITSYSPAAIKLGRNAFHSCSEMGFNESLQYLLSQLTLNLQTEDAKEGTLAFLQKRPPKWTGK